MSEIDKTPADQVIRIVNDRFDACDEALAEGASSEVIAFLTMRALKGSETLAAKWGEHLSWYENQIQAAKKAAKHG